MIRTSFVTFEPGDGTFQALGSLVGLFSLVVEHDAPLQKARKAYEPNVTKLRRLMLSIDEPR